MLFLFFLFFFFFGSGIYMSLISYFSMFLKGVLDLNPYFFISSFIGGFIYILVFYFCLVGFFMFSFGVLLIFSFTFFLSFCFWLMSFFIFFSSENFLVYLSKSGDLFLNSLVMILIEVVSEFSRPISLSIRLFVNILVGHYLLLSVYMFFESMEFFCFSFFSIIFFFLEFFVFFIQTFVFSRLIYLYISE